MDNDQKLEMLRDSVNSLSEAIVALVNAQRMPGAAPAYLSQAETSARSAHL